MHVVGPKCLAEKVDRCAASLKRPEHYTSAVCTEVAEAVAKCFSLAWPATESSGRATSGDFELLRFDFLPDVHGKAPA